MITLKQGITHEESAVNVSGGDEALRSGLNVEELITADYPPTFAWVCEDDDCVPPVNSRLLKAARNKNGVKNEVHFYPYGGHGCGLAYGNSAYGWSQKMLEFLKSI